MVGRIRNRLAAVASRFPLGGRPSNRVTPKRRSPAARLRALGDRLARSPKPSLRTTAVTVAAALVGVVAAQGLRHRSAALQVVREHPYFRVEHIEIRGAGILVHEAELRQWLGVREGDSLWRTTPEAIEAQLESHPMLRSATARRVFPGTLQIHVEERRPVAIAVLDGLYYLDSDGDSFGPLGTKHGRDFPVFTGIAGGVDGHRRWALRRALQLIESSAGGEIDLGSSELHLDPADGLVLFPEHPRVSIYLGWRAWESRIERAGRVLASWGDAAGKLARVDLRFRDQVVVRLREPRGVGLAVPAAQVST
jgi:cell division septal protein FtsQ